MKTNTILNRFLGLCCTFLVVSAFWGCEREYLWYDAEAKDGVRFMGDDTAHVFTQVLGEEKWVKYRDVVTILGFTRNVNRHFKVEVVDSLTTIPADCFSLDSCYITAGEVFGYLNFSYVYSETDTLSLGLRIVENDNFRPVMLSQVCFLLYPYKLTEPSWWKADNYMFGQPWTPRLNELFFQFYHAVEQDEPYVWTSYFESDLGKDCEMAYKHYDLGWWIFPTTWHEPYQTLLRKYVARPLYDYLKEHPEDGDYTSMPDPYL